MSTKPDFVFTKENYMLLIIGAVLVATGYLLMVGGGSDDPNVFNEKELFSFRRITLSTIVCLAGFVTVIFSIMKRPKNQA